MDNANIDQHDRLRDLLRAARPTATVPTGFQDAVWRRIERLEAVEKSPDSSWFVRLAGMLMQPRLAGALAAVMVLLGAGLGAWQGTADAHQSAQARYLAKVAPSAVR